MPQDQFDYSKLSDETLIELRDTKQDYSKMSDKALLELRGSRMQPAEDLSKTFEIEKTPTLDTIKDIAGRYGVSEETLRSRAAGIGMPAEDVSTFEKGLSKVVGVGNAALLGLPSFVAKKLEDEHTEKAIDELKDRLEKQKSGIQTGIETVAGLAVPIPGAGLIRGLGAGLTGAKGVAAGVGKAAAEGAIAGGLGGLAQSKYGHELEGIKDAAGTSALFGAGVGAAGQGLKRVASALGEKGSQIAGERGIKAILQKKSQLDKLKSGVGGLTQKEFGSALLNESFTVPTEAGAKSFKLVEAADSAENVLEKAKLAKDAIGKQIGSFVSETGNAPQVNMMNVYSRVNQELDKIQNVPFSGRIRNELKQELDTLVEPFQNQSMPGVASVGFEDATMLRRNIDEMAEHVFEKTDPRSKWVKKFRAILEDEIEKSLPDSGPYKDIKRKYKILNRAEELAEDKVSGEQSRRIISPSSIALGGLAYLGTQDDSQGGGVLKGTAAALANQLALKRGPATTAVAVNNIAKALKENPLSFGKWGSILKNAAIKGNAQLQATIERLTQTDPEFKATVESNIGQP